MYHRRSGVLDGLRPPSCSEAFKEGGSDVLEQRNVSVIHCLRARTLLTCLLVDSGEKYQNVSSQNVRTTAASAMSEAACRFDTIASLHSAEQLRMSKAAARYLPQWQRCALPTRRHHATPAHSAHSKHTPRVPYPCCVATTRASPVLRCTPALAAAHLWRAAKAAGYSPNTNQLHVLRDQDRRAETLRCVWRSG